MTKQVAIYAAAVMTTLLALMALWQFRTVILYVVISLALSAAVRPLVSRLVGRKPVGENWIDYFLSWSSRCFLWIAF